VGTTGPPRGDGDDGVPNYLIIISIGVFGVVAGLFLCCNVIATAIREISD
jgi:hypothetical protein